MTHINIKISKAVATAEKDSIITAGMVGVPISFMFDSWWDGLIALIYRSITENSHIFAESIRQYHKSFTK